VSRLKRPNIKFNARGRGLNSFYGSVSKAFNERQPRLLHPIIVTKSNLSQVPLQSISLVPYTGGRVAVLQQ
jgi:hypothetical protein